MRRVAFTSEIRQGMRRNVTRRIGVSRPSLLDFFLWGDMKILIYETPVESEKKLLERVMAATDVGLAGIGHCVYQTEHGT